MFLAYNPLITFSLLQMYGGQRIFSSTMTHNRRACATIFLEAEYDDLTIEAYSQPRVTIKRSKNGMFPFSCLFCKVIQKYKNMISYHRMFRLCKVYKGFAPLKIYPT